MGNCCCLVEPANTSNEIKHTSGYIKDTKDGHEGIYGLSALKPPSEINCSERGFPVTLDVPRLDVSGKDLNYRSCDDVSTNDLNHELSTSMEGLNFEVPSDIFFNKEIVNFKDLSSSCTSDLQATTDEAIWGTEYYGLKTECDCKNPQTRINETFPELPLITWQYEQSSDQPTATEFISKPADSEEKSWNLPLSKIISINNHGLSIAAFGCELTMGSEMQLSVMGIDLLKMSNSTNNKFGLFQK